MLTTDQIKELETKHDEIAHLVDKHGRWEAVFRKPNRGEYKQMRSEVHNQRLMPEAAEKFARKLVVHPTHEEFDAMLEKWPAIGDAAGPKLLELAGLSVDDDLKS